MNSKFKDLRINKKEVEAQIEEPLKTREKLGKVFGDYLKKQGFESILAIGNVPDALSQKDQYELKRHGVPADLYAGRLPWIMSGLFLKEMDIYIPMDESYRNFEEEENYFSKQITEKFDFNIKVISEKERRQKETDPKVFIYPFIASLELTKKYLNRTLPSSQYLNDKAFMRKFIKEIGGEEFLVGGEEIFVEDKTTKQCIEEVKEKIDAHFKLNKDADTLMLKFSTGASGLSNFKISRDLWDKEENYKKNLLKVIEKRLNQNAGDIVIEEFINHHTLEDEFNDYGLRGFILPGGEALFLSAGRMLVDKNGEYIGCVIAPPNNSKLLKNMGITKDSLTKILFYGRNLSSQIYNKFNYFGPINLDLFVSKRKPAQFLIHDYNFREGGTSASGFIATVSSKIFEKENLVVDTEFHLKSPKILKEDEINNLIGELYKNGCIPYSTSFLRVFKQKGEEVDYVLKLMIPSESILISNEQIQEELDGIVKKINSLSAFRTLNVALEKPILSK